MSIPTPDFLLCPICRTRFNGTTKKPISLLCGHTCCSSCLQLMHRKQCPLDATPFQQEDIDSFPTNQALLLLVTENKTEENTTKALQNGDDSKNDEKVVGQCIGELALYLKPLSSGNQKTGNSITLSRPMQRKLVALVHCQLAEPVGRARALRAARSLGERTCTELILQHQNQQQLSSMLWAAVRTRGCQFLGPAMQEAALKYILLSLEQGEALSRKVLVLYVVQQLESHFPQASKTSIGHVVQLLYRASCFKVAKRNDDSSLMQLKEEYRTYEALRREHDAQIVNMAQEAGIRIPPDQWSQLLYGDTAHKSHMQSIIDRLQTPASFTQSIQELMIALSRTEDTHNLSGLSNDFNTLAAINPVTEDSSVTWSQLKVALIALRNVVKGLERFLQAKAKVKGLTEHTAGCLHDNCNAHGKYKTTMCRDLLLPQSCPRGASCTFAHTQDEMERYRSQKKTMKHLSEAEHSANCSVANSPNVSTIQTSSVPSSSPIISVSQPVISQQLKVSQPQVPQGMLPPPPPGFAPQNIAGLPPTNGHHLPTTRSWNGNILTPDPRLATPRLPAYQHLTSPHRQLDPETLQLLQLKQQLLQQGVHTPLPPPPPAAPLPTSLHNLTTEQLLSHATQQFASVPSSRSNGLNAADYSFGTVPNVTNIDQLNHRLHSSQPPPPQVSATVRAEAQVPLWDQPTKINGLTNAASATSGAPATPNLWGGQYDPIVSQLNGYDEAQLLRQELLKQYSQLSLATTPGLSSTLLNQLQAQQHAASPSPALSNFPNYNATNLLASRINQLRLTQHLENPAAYPTVSHAESLSNGLNGYDRILPQAATPTVQQIKYELAKAESNNFQKYEQLLNSGLSHSALLSQLQSSGLSNGLSNGLSSDFAKSASHINPRNSNPVIKPPHTSTKPLQSLFSSNTIHQFDKRATPMDPYSSGTPNIWQNDSTWHSLLSSRPTSVALGGSGGHHPTSVALGGSGGHHPQGDMDASLQQLLQHYDRNLAFQFQLDDVE